MAIAVGAVDGHRDDVVARCSKRVGGLRLGRVLTVAEVPVPSARAERASKFELQLKEVVGEWEAEVAQWEHGVVVLWKKVLSPLRGLLGL